MPPPRTFQPASFISEAATERLADMPIQPWDVMTASTFLKALGVSDTMMVNRGIYRGSPGTPPFEKVGLWRGGSGAPRVIRKDRAVAWATSGGESVPARACWPLAAATLAELGWPGLDGPDAVQDILSLLLRPGILQLAVPLRDHGHIDQLYL